MTSDNNQEKGPKMEWYVMRDLHRGHCKVFAYEELAQKGFRTYTPTIKKPKLDSKGKATIVERPYLPDLFFVYGDRKSIESLIHSRSFFQFRFKYGVSPVSPIVVPSQAMEDFISANKSSDETRFFLVSSIPKSARNCPIRIIGGPLNGLEGLLLRTRGTTRKQLVIELPHFLAISVHVEDEYIELL